MNRILILLLCSSFLCFSQESNNEDSNNLSSKKNEIKIGAAKLLAPVLDVGYERVTGNYFGYGANLIVALKGDVGGFYEFGFSPFVRMYFNENKDFGNKGLFIEGFLLANLANPSDDEIFTTDSFVENEESFFDTAIGFGIGKKWVNKKGFVFEFLFGLGRNLFNEESSDFLFKGDFSIGYRF